MWIGRGWQINLIRRDQSQEVIRWVYLVGCGICCDLGQGQFACRMVELTYPRYHHLFRPLLTYLATNPHLLELPAQRFAGVLVVERTDKMDTHKLIEKLVIQTKAV